MSNESLFRLLQFVTIPSYLLLIGIMNGLHRWLQWSFLDALAAAFAIAILMHHFVYAVFSIVCMRSERRQSRLVTYYLICFALNAAFLLAMIPAGPALFKLLA